LASHEKAADTKDEPSPRKKEEREREGEGEGERETSARELIKI
jgi:hypothetical protein